MRWDEKINSMCTFWCARDSLEYLPFDSYKIVIKMLVSMQTTFLPYFRHIFDNYFGCWSKEIRWILYLTWISMQILNLSVHHSCWAFNFCMACNSELFRKILLCSRHNNEVSVNCSFAHFVRQLHSFGSILWNTCGYKRLTSFPNSECIMFRILWFNFDTILRCHETL